MTADARQANQRNQCQEWPPLEATTNRRDLAAIANRAINTVLIKDLDIALWLLRSDRCTGIQGSDVLGSKCRQGAKICLETRGRGGYRRRSALLGALISQPGS